jgi:branched-chain amino acid transport system ATP-binding protein
MNERPDESAPLVRAEDLTVRFGGLSALEGVGFEIAHDEIFGIIGPNGAGKSTLINVLSGIYPLTRGRLSFDGATLGGLKPHRAVRRGIVRTFQNSRLFTDLSVLDNVLIGMHTRMKGGVLDAALWRWHTRRDLARGTEEAVELLRELGPALVERRHTPAGVLPQADKRRVEIARALASGPRLLMLDEPSAGMGSADTQRLVEDIKRLKAQRPGLSVVVIEHDLALMRTLPERVMVLDYGERIALDTFEAAVQVEAVREAYLGSKGAEHA